MDHTAAARALFDQGLEFLYAERWGEAADRFQRAQVLRPSPQITYNLTTALVGMGRLVRASELALQVSLDPSATPQVREASSARRDQLLPRLASLTVRVSAELDDADLFFDESPLEGALVGVSVPVDPGDHEIVARRGRREVGRLRLTLAEGASREVTLGATRAENASVARRWWFWTIIGAIVATAVVVPTAVVLTRDEEPAPPLNELGATIFVGGDR